MTKSCIPLLASFPQLKVVELTGMNHTNPSNLDLDLALVSLSNAVPHLESFSLRNCPYIRNGATALISNTKLHTLIVDSCARIQTQVLHSLLSSPNPLQVLGLKNCPGISPQILSELLVVKGSTLLKLDLGGNHWVSDEHISLIARNCIHLAILHVNGCKMISSLGMDVLRQKRGRKLVEIGMNDMPQLSNACIERIRSTFGFRAVLSVMT
jgi:hypothetical protein